MDSIQYKGGQFVMSADNRAYIQAMLRKVGSSGDEAEHKMLAERIIAPIQQIADYEEWSQVLWQSQDVGPTEMIYIAQDSPGMVASYTSANGEVAFTRPGRTTYVTPSFTMVDCGLEIGWDDMAVAGWDILGQRVKEAGEELARKRDDAGLATLNTAAASIANHNPSCSGGAMTKAAVDAIFRAAAVIKYKISTVIINSGDIMDMSDWVWSDSDHLWEAPLDANAEIFKNFYVSGYGGANWYQFASAAAHTIWFAATPDVMGAYRWRKGGLRTASAVDIKKRVDYHTWDEKWGYWLSNPYGLWKLSITA